MSTNHYDWASGTKLPKLLRHSEVKHSLLRDYLVEYFLTLISSPNQDRIRLTVVDGFCGGGRYVNEAGVVVPGSPVVILKAIEEAQAQVFHSQQRRKPIDFDVELICIDQDGSAIAQLRAVLEEHGFGEKLRNESIRLITGEFTALSDQVIARAKARSPKSGRALFVLDQYGYDKVPASALKQIFQTLSHAEVILTFNVDALINYLSPKNLLDFERKTGIHGTVAAADLDKALRGPAWRARIQANLYRRITEDSGAQYFTPFFIRPQSGHGDFWLLHLSQHWKARDVMTTAHWQHHNHFIHYGKAGFDMLSTGYAARIDDAEQMQAGFEFDDAAANASQQEMRVQIPRALHELPEGITFERFFLGRVNTTPATRGMIESALLQLVRDKAIEIVGSEGDVRNVRSAVQGHHILRLPKQKSLTFGGI